MNVIDQIKLWYNLRKLKKIQPKREDAALVYTDSLGNKWFTVSPSSLHATRSLAAWLLSEDSEYGLTREKLKSAFKKINKLFNENNIAGIPKVIGVMEAALDIYALPEVMLNVASCYTFLNDEPDEYLDHWQKKKREIWEKDYECRSFFLQYALRYMKNHSESQPQNAQEYLQEIRPVLDQINYHLK